MVASYAGSNPLTWNIDMVIHTVSCSLNEWTRVALNTVNHVQLTCALVLSLTARQNTCTLDAPSFIRSYIWILVIGILEVNALSPRHGNSGSKKTGCTSLYMMCRTQIISVTHVLMLTRLILTAGMITRQLSVRSCLKHTTQGRMEEHRCLSLSL